MPHSLQQTAIRENPSPKAVVQQSSTAVCNINSVSNTQPTPITLNVPSIPSFHNGRMWQTASRENHSLVVVQQNSATVRNTIPATNTQSRAIFKMKWVPGTRILVLWLQQRD